MPTCIWPQEYEIEFVGKHLGPLLEQNGLKTEIWILDHNYNLWGRAINELDDPGVKKYSNAVAWHGYVGKAGMASKVYEAHPDAAMHWTEGGPDYTNPDYETDWAKWGVTFTSALRNWCQSLTAWNLALDERGRPNIGPFPCGGVVTIHSETRAIKHSGQYWAFAQLARLVKRGAVRVDSTSVASEVSHVAFENPSGENVLLLTNPGQAKTIELRVGPTKAAVQLEADSVTTLAWNAS
jgi:glucosylceramidase